MTNLLYLVILTLASLSLGNATTVTFTGLPPVIDQNHIYNGFATATVDGQPGNLLICDDASHRTPGPPFPELEYNVSYLTAFQDGPDPLHGARFVTSPPTEPEKDRYRAAAILVAGLLAAGPNAPASLVTNYQYALWNLFTPSVGLSQAQLHLQDAAIAMVEDPSPLVQARLVNNIYPNLRIYTPVGLFVSNQEFVQLVPEPGYSAALLVAVALGCYVRRRRRA